jgi:hypothetical protein
MSGGKDREEEGGGREVRGCYRGEGRGSIMVGTKDKVKGRGTGGRDVEQGEATEDKLKESGDKVKEAGRRGEGTWGRQEEGDWVG